MNQTLIILTELELKIICFELFYFTSVSFLQHTFKALEYALTF